MKRYTILFMALAMVAAMLPGCRRNKPEPTTKPTTMPTSAPTTEPTTRPTTAPTTQATQEPSMPSDMAPEGSEGDTGAAQSEPQEGARQIMPKGMH